MKKNKIRVFNVEYQKRKQIYYETKHYGTNPQWKHWETEFEYEIPENIKYKTLDDLKWFIEIVVLRDIEHIRWRNGKTDYKSGWCKIISYDIELI